MTDDGYAQNYSRYNTSLYFSYDRYAYAPAYRFHTSIRPLMLSEVDSVITTDSLLNRHEDRQEL